MRRFQANECIVHGHLQMIMRLQDLGDEVTLFLDFSAGDDVRADVVIDPPRHKLGRYVTKQKLPVGLLRCFKLCA